MSKSPEYEEARAEAQKIYHELLEAKGEIARLVDKTGDRDPRLLFAAGVVIGGLLVFVAGMVL